MTFLTKMHMLPDLMAGGQARGGGAERASAFK